LALSVVPEPVASRAQRRTLIALLLLLGLAALALDLRYGASPTVPQAGTASTDPQAGTASTDPQAGMAVFMLGALTWSLFLTEAWVRGYHRQQDSEPSTLGTACRSAVAASLGVALVCTNLDAVLFVDANRCAANQRLLAAALRQYAAGHKGHYPARLEELTPSLLRQLPRCLAGHSGVAERYYAHAYGLSFGPYAYAPSVDRRSYKLGCGSTNHLRGGIAAGRPSISSTGAEDPGVPPQEMVHAYDQPTQDP
jgi:hypothetical protein